MASIDRVMALADEINKKKKKKDYEINTSIVNVNDIANEMKRGNTKAIKEFNYNPINRVSSKKKQEENGFKKVWNTIKGIGGNFYLGGEEGVGNSADYVDTVMQYILKKGTGKVIEKHLEKNTDLSENTVEKLTDISSTILSDYTYNKMNETEMNDIHEINETLNSEKRQQWRSETIQSNIDSSSGKVGKYVAELAPSIGQNTVNTMATAINPTLGTVMFMTSAGGSYLDEARDRGMDEDSALAYSTIMGGMEGLTERFLAGQTIQAGATLFGAKELTKETLTNVTKSFGFNIFENFIQEAAIEPINEVTAQVVAGKEYADWDNIVQRSLKAGFDGAVSAVILNGMSAGIGSCARIYTKVQNGQKATQAEVTQAINDAREAGIDVDQIAMQNIQEATNIATQEFTQQQNIQQQNTAHIENTIEQNNVQEQIRRDSENFAKQIDHVNSIKENNALTVLSSTPQVYRDLGLDNLPMTITKNHTLWAMTEKSKDNSHLHGLSKEIIKQVPEALTRPLNIVESGSKKGSIVAITELADNDGNLIIVPIKVNGKANVNEIEIEANVLTSVYGKDNDYDKWMKGNIKNNRVLYDIDEGIIKKYRDNPPRLQLSNDITSTDANASYVNNSITSQNKNVNYTNRYAQQEQNNTQNKEKIAPVEGQQNEEVSATSEETQEKIAEILPETPKLKNKDQRLWTKFRAGIFDKGSIFEDLSLITNNRELMGKWDYMLTSEARAQNAMLNGTKEFDATTKTEIQVSKSLYDIQTEVGDNIQEFSNYLYHKHNISRMSLESKAQVQMAELEILKEYNIEEIEKISRKRVTDKTSKDTEELIEKAKEYIRLSKVKNKPVFAKSVTAEISQKIVDQYENNNPEFMDWAKDVYDYNKANLNQLVKSGIISEETADRFAEMYPYYVPIARANVKGYAINVPLDTNRTGVNAPIKKAKGGNKDILPLFDTMARRTLQTYKAVAKNNFGVELKNTLNSVVDNQETNVDEILKNVDQQDELLKEGKNGNAPTFTVFENGEKVTYEITKDMYDALRPISDSSILSTTFKPFNKISNFHRGVLTEYNPVFMLVNGIKDAQDILLNSQHPAKTYAKFGEAYAQMIKKGYWYQEYMANGGVRNSYFDSQEGTFNTEKKGLTDILPLKQISKSNNLIEMAPRLAEYIASREEGRSIEVSMLDAARVTTNFKAGGDITKWANRNGATFLNASIQGAMQQVRNVREAHANGLKGYANLALKFTLAGLPAILLNGLLWEDDEEYEELSDYVKQNYYIVGKYGDGNFIRIPKGRMVSVIQESFNQMKHLITGDDEADLGQFLEVLGNNLAPNNPIQDNVLSPIIQAATNTTWYGDDLVPTRLQDEPVEEQFDESTDKLSIFLGQKLGISPYKINYVLDQYTGGIGDIFLPMMTQQAENRTDSLLGELISPLTDKFTVDSVMKNQNVSDLYEKSEELTSKANSTSATDEDILQNKYLNSIKTEMNELYRQKREIQNSSLSNSKKYEKVREIQEKINNMAKKAMNNYENIKKTSNYATVGNKEYYLKDDTWTKVKNDELAELKSLNMSIKDKSTYFKLKEEINNIKISDVDNEKAQIATAVKNTNLADEQKAYVYGKYYASDETLDMVINSGISFNEYLNFASQEFVADKDSNGKSISGSRKTKIIKYINSLQLSIPQKAMLIRTEYSTFDSYNKEIIEYVKNLKIDYAEKVSILEGLGMKVDNVKVTW